MRYGTLLADKIVPDTVVVPVQEEQLAFYQIRRLPCEPFDCLAGLPDAQILAVDGGREISL